MVYCHNSITKGRSSASVLQRRLQRMAGPMKPNDPNRREDSNGGDDKKRAPLGFFSIVLWAMMLVFMLNMCRSRVESAAVETVDYSDFYEWVDKGYVAEVKLKRLRKYMPVARSHMEENTKEYVPWTTGVEFEPVFRLGDNMMESFSRLERVERLCKRLPGLDCGSCGALPARPWRRILSGARPASGTVCTICGIISTSCPRKWPCWRRIWQSGRARMGIRGE